MNANNDEGKLISGKEALDSYFESQVCEESDDPKWVDLKECKYSVSQILKEKDQRISCHISLKFRLAPRTITINGIEVPAPFKPKLGEKYWIIETSDENSYSYISSFGNDEQDKCLIQLGAWRTEEEIKQVVAALRQVFGGAA